MPHVWREIDRQRSPRTWLGIGASTSTGPVLACRNGLALWDLSRCALFEHPLDHDAVSIATAREGGIVCVGEDQTTILTGRFRIERVLHGPERPHPNRNGHYAMSEAYFVHLTMSSAGRLVARRSGSWDIAAECPIGPEWVRAPMALYAVSENAFLMECAQEELTALVEVSSKGISVHILPFWGSFLGFLDDGKSYACDWGGRVTVSAFPGGTRIRDFSVEVMTPITVPDVFSVVSRHRGASAANAELMFDDVFIDGNGKEAPFALWTGSWDGQTVCGVHKDGTLRLWGLKLADPYRQTDA